MSKFSTFTTAHTLQELLESNRSVRRHVGYLEGESQERLVTYEELHERALGILRHLQDLGARPGDPLILFVAGNEQFIDAFWAAIQGGIIPVPVAIGMSEEHRLKLLRIARKLGRPFIYADRKALDRVGSFATNSADAATYAHLRGRAFYVDQVEELTRHGKPHKARPGDTAFIQFSSGSTSEPKGVVLTHANVLANARGVAEAADLRQEETSLSWMPLTHDMGLIGFHIILFAARLWNYLMPTDLFVRRPLLWMQLAARKRITVTSSPNFGYRHYLKVLGDRSLEGLDLSSLRLIFNGAEPISAALCEEFLTRLAPTKLAPTAMFPVYGLAEATLAVSFSRPDAAIKTVTLDRHRLGVEEVPRPVARADRDASEFVSVGRAVPFCNLRLTGASGALVATGAIGHIEISGANVTSGYFEDTAANAAGFTPDGWLRTGDLGVQIDGDLYITGRAKEIIFVNGQNYYPHDLENIAQHVPGLELGKVVAAASRPPGADTDLLVMFVLHRMDMREFLPIAAEVARLINEHTGLEVSEVVPVKRIPKTTSGKIQRHLLENAYREGEFATELAELAALRAASPAFAHAPEDDVEARLKAICDAALDGRNVAVDDNLFELGASSLKLIEIHEKIDVEYPGQIDLTELFDYPTIAELARHLKTKLASSL
jgi:acyl-CoA synthetase (AMP-forming)/AMP-acid ligase II/acyl carrier protein